MIKTNVLILFCLVFFVSCSKKTEVKISKKNIMAGTKVLVGEIEFKLYGGSIKVGDNLNNILEKTLDNRPIKNISIINVVPSIDTSVCEEQTHLLGETKSIRNFDKLTISRDLPMAQKSFAKEANLDNITYLSD
jgi:thiol peroxidase